MINLSEFHNYVADNQPNICQVTVIQNSRTIISDTWNGYKADDTVHTMSVTKSIVSLLVGIAIEQGLIGSVDDYVLDYFPDYKIKRGEKTIQKVTLKNLLTMTAPYKYKYEPWKKNMRTGRLEHCRFGFFGRQAGYDRRISILYFGYPYSYRHHCNSK